MSIPTFSTLCKLSIVCSLTIFGYFRIATAYCGVDAATITLVQDVNFRSLAAIPLYQKCCVGLCFLLSLVTTFFVYATCFRGLDLSRSEKDVGYFIDSNLDRREAVNRIRRLRAIGDLPPAYANGWYALIESHRLKKGEVKSVNMCGMLLAAFRDDYGSVHVLDAYCPHLGANLGMGGRVRGDTIECPFHAWRFNGEDGRCVEVPYLKSGKIPEQARVKSHNTHEVNGWINVWYDAEGREPKWRIPEYEDITKKTLQFCGRTEHFINCHMEEIPENGADLAHLPVIHGPSLFAGIDIRNMFGGFWSFTEHQWDSSWEATPSPDNHMAVMKLIQGISFFGITIPFTEVNVRVDQVGPAIVYLNFNTIFGRCVIQHVVTPQEPMLQKLVHNVYANAWMPMFFAKILMKGMAMQVERDVFVWNNKKYMSKPVLLKTSEDSLILRHRRWFNQFYSENSPKIQMQRDGLDW